MLFCGFRLVVLVQLAWLGGLIWLHWFVTGLVCLLFSFLLLTSCMCCFDVCGLGLLILLVLDCCFMVC